MSYYNKFTNILIFQVQLNSFTAAGTTGKISGKVVDQETGEPLIGCNVIISEIALGAATNLDGTYFILNVPPGSYTLRASMIGYGSVQMNDLQVILDLPAKADFFLERKSY